MDLSKLTKIVSSGVSGLLLQGLSPQQSNFKSTNNKDNESMTTTQVIVIIIVILLLYTLFGMATYKLTKSTTQTILCILFGGFYIMLAYLYYAFAGYKFILKD